jgi:serine/threonine protein kinase
MTLPVGTALGSYRVTALLGAGGMGEVYRAHDPNLGRDVAIKVLPESVAKDAEALARFEREARAVAALSHPNIRGIHELGRQGELVFAVMELLEGEPLRAKLLDGPLPQKLALDYALQAARGLSAAHEKRIVHRDLKPENLFVTQDGFVKILDFGLAKQHVVPVAKEETSAPTATVSPGHHASDTEPGVVLGTLDYMSPEQVRGLPVDHRSDIFSFGAVLHEMLTGTKAFHRGSAADTMAAITRDEPASRPGAEALPPALDQSRAPATSPSATQEASGALSRVDPPSLKRGIEHYERAVALDPSFALAWAQLGGARSLLYFTGTPTPELAAGTKAGRRQGDRAGSRAGGGIHRDGDLREERAPREPARPRIVREGPSARAFEWPGAHVDRAREHVPRPMGAGGRGAA